MTAMLLAMVLVGSPASMDSGFVYTATYEMSADVAKEVEASSGHWIPTGERQFPFARVGNRELAIRATWTGYRGRFAAHVVVDSSARVKEIKWIETWGRIARSRRRALPELAEPVFINQYVGMTLEDLVARRSEIRSPRISGSTNPMDYRNMTTAIVVEALVAAREVGRLQ